MHISLAAERLFSIGSFNVTNSYLASVLVTVMLTLFAIAFSRNILSPNSRIRSLLEILVDWIQDIAVSAAGAKAALFLPLVLTIFIYVLLSNWMGLLPGFGSIGFYKMEEGHRIFIPLLRGATADLNTTLAIALIAVFAIQFYGVREHSFGYFKKFINFSSPINFFAGVLEIISEISKIFSFSFRLYGNIFAGEVLIAVITSLVPIIAPLPFFGLEIFVGLIQALVFALLTLVFVSMSIKSHEETSDHESLRPGKEVEYGS